MTIPNMKDLARVGEKNLSRHPKTSQREKASAQRLGNPQIVYDGTSRPTERENVR